MTDAVNKLKFAMSNTEELYELIRFQFPDLVADLARAKNFLISDSSNTEKAEQIMAAISVNEFLVHNRSHNKSCPTDKPYKIYKDLFPSGKLKERQFNTVYSIVHHIDLSPIEYELSKGSLQAVEIWKNLGEIPESINKYVRIISNDTRSAMQMYRLHLTTDDDEGSRRKSFFKAIELIGKRPENRIDAVCAAYLFNGRDVLLENLLAYYKFTSRIDPADKDANVLIIGASPLFIRRWMRDSSMAFVKVTFAVESVEMRDVFAAFYAKKTHIHFVTMDEVRSLSNLSYTKNIMIFGNHVSHGYIELIHDLKAAASNEHTLFYLGADTYLTRKESQLAQMLQEEDMQLKEVNLLPAGIHDTSDPQRKCLLYCTFGYIDKQPNAIVEIKCYALDTSGEIQSLRPKTYIEKRRWEELIPEIQNIRNIYRIGEFAALKKTEGKRQLPIEFPFTQEITVYATASLPENSKDNKLRVEGYVKIPGSSRLKRDRLEASIKRTKKIQSNELNIWATSEYPYSTVIRDGQRLDIREIIGEEYRAAYQGKPVTFKTLIYLYPEIEIDMAKIAQKRLRELCESDIGDTLVTQITMDFALFVLNTLYPGEEQEVAWLQARRVLADALSVAVKNGHCDRNEIREELNRDNTHYASLQNVKKNIGKRFFTMDELRKIYSSICQEIVHGKMIFIGVLLSFLYGLESNVVCALKWKDLKIAKNFVFQGKPIYLLYIRRQLQNDGKAYKKFEKLYSYRVIPCHWLLAEILLEERERQRAAKDYLTEEAFAEEAILQGEKMILANNIQVVAPQKMSKLCRSVIRDIGIPDQIIPIPDDGKGTTESNLVNYSIDFFRANFRHYGLTICKFDPGELAYILGNKGPTTYDRNYCDYSNEKSQLILLIKQHRLVSLLTEKMPLRGKCIVKNGVSLIEFTTQINEASTAGTEMMLTVPKNTALHLSVDTEYGFSGCMAELEEEM